MPDPVALKLKPSARIAAKEIDELSGMVRSRRYPDTYWVHNDSGDKARFFGISGNGALRCEVTVRGAENEDWEDICLADGQVYLADTGNNDNDRRDLCLYRCPEPDPRQKKAVVTATRIPVAYPDQDGFPPRRSWRFDCEAVFFYQGKPHLLTKQRAPRLAFLPEDATNLYRVEGPGRLTLLDSRRQLGGWVTAADLSPDGRLLAVLCQAPVAGIWIFDLNGVGNWLLSRPVKRVVLQNARQCEALCWDDPTALRLGNEQRELFRVTLGEIPAYRPAPGGN